MALERLVELGREIRRQADHIADALLGQADQEAEALVVVNRSDGGTEVRRVPVR